MNRRNFLGNLIVAGASFHILPGSGRIWVAQRDTRAVFVKWDNSDFERALHEFLMTVKANLIKMHLEEQ